MSGPWNLGNDVVDLFCHGTSGKARDPRFLSRVFSEGEQGTILSSPDPDRALWLHWAGKEAIYKSASKALGTPPVFAHSLFQVTFSEKVLHEFLCADPGHPGGLLTGRGSYRDLSFHIQAKGSDSFVHAVSWTHHPEGGPPDFRWSCHRTSEETRGSSSELRGHFSEAEWGCVTHRASALARIMAREALAATLEVETERLQIRCGEGPPGRRIPSVWLDEAELPVDLTLSHHGPFLAWAFLTP